MKQTSGDTAKQCSGEVSVEAEALASLLASKNELIAKRSGQSGLDGALDSQVLALARVYELASKSRGCQISYLIGAEGVRAACQKSSCGFSKDFS